MFCSTIIPTVGRASLARAVASVLDQPLPPESIQVIVVNDGGRPLPAEAWHADPRVTVIDTQRRERGAARNVGAAVARGRYLHFLDDDDYLLPGSIAAFQQLAAQRPDAAVLYGVTLLADRQGQPVIHLRHNLPEICFLQTMAGEWIPLQASLIEATAFFRTGGFNPLIPGAEDIDLMRRMTLRELAVATAVEVACVEMGETNSTTDYGRHPRFSRAAREAILNERGAWSRLRRSAASPAWHGRLVRIYLTSVAWNLRRGRLFTAGSRLLAAAGGLVAGGGSLFSAAFWRAVRSGYESEAFLDGFAAEQKRVERRMTDAQRRAQTQRG